MAKFNASGTHQQNDVTLSVDTSVAVQTINDRSFFKLTIAEAKELLADLEYAINYAESD